MWKYISAVLLTLWCCKTVSAYEYETKTFTVPLDHFSFTTNETFNLRYLINDTYWNQERGPIFFYTGNEGSIEMFANNTGFLWESAETFNALIVFAEHRYYGNSLPFGNQSYSDPKHLGYLTSEQALADYVDLITFLRTNKTSYYKNPVIAFGGSYGGMLAAYLRMKYPHIVIGALASSAPIWQFTGLTPCNVFSALVTSVFKAESVSCYKSVRKSWPAIDNVTSTEDGRKWLSSEWNLCKPLKDEKDVKALKDYLTESYGILAMINYPYPTNFMADVPANPVNEFCKRLKNSTAPQKDLLKMVFEGISIYFNNTGKSKCFSYEESSSNGLDYKGWDYQSCTEMVMPMCSNGNMDMFETAKWDIRKYSQECFNNWHVTPKPTLAVKTYGGKDIGTASNIIFSNGLLDPWIGGGVLKAPSKSIMVFIIPRAAHHLDLRATNQADPLTVRTHRTRYQQIFKQWIEEYEKEFGLF